MSLINDALKRASQTHREQPREASLDTPLQPVQAQPASKAPLIAGLCLLGVLILSGVFFWQWWHGKHHPTPLHVLPHVANIVPTAAPVTQPAPAPTLPSAKSAAEIKPIPAPVPASAVSVETATPALPAVAVDAPAPSPPAIEPPPAPIFPTLKLKGIFYNAKTPLTLINSQTLGIGDKIEGARISKIDPQKVTLEWNGQTKELLLDGP
jgi:MSHA biogenesis protein MshK